MASTWDTSTQVDWDKGTYINTTSNSTGTLFLNQTTYPDDGTASDGVGGMVAWYHLDETSGVDADDETSALADGTLMNMGTDPQLDNESSGWNSSGKFSNAISFDGLDDFVNISKVEVRKGFFNYTSGTIACWTWLNNEGMAANLRMYGEENTAGAATGVLGYSGAEAAKNWQFALNDDTGWHSLKAVIPNSGQWYHVVGTWGSAGMKLYVNGTEVSSGSYTGGSTRANYSYIGRHGTEYMDGKVDEIALWNRTLSADEIADLYRRKRGTYQSEIKDFGADQEFVLANHTFYENSSLNNITYQVRSCNDASCSGEDFEGYDGTSTYFNETSINWTLDHLTDNQYLQYKIWFERNNSVVDYGHPQVFNISFDYSIKLFSIAISPLGTIIPNVKGVPYVQLNQTLTF